MRLPRWDLMGIKGFLSVGLLILIIIIPDRQASAGRKRERGSRGGNRGNSHGPPTFRPTPNNITVGPGDRAVLKCKVENLGTKMITWRRHAEVHPLTIGMFTFAPDTRITVDFNQRTNEWSLIIQDIKPSDEGVYHCAISTKNEDNLKYDIRLNVKNVPITEPKTAVQVSGTEYVERGSPVQLMCNATGKPDPPHNVEWYKDGEKINSDAQSGIIITKKIETKVLVSMLVIKSSKMTDGGDYICRSSNRDTGKIKVHILNVAAPVEKRDSTGEQASNLTSSTVRISSRLFSTVSLFFVTLCLLTRWEHLV